MKRTKDWPAEPTPPGDLGLLLAFLNTEDPDSETDALDSTEALAFWLERQKLLPGPADLDEADLELARAARRGLRALLGAHGGEKPDPGAVAGLDQVAAQACCRVRFDEDGTTRFEPGPLGLGGALGRLFGIVAVAQIEGRWPRLKVCSNPACRRAFYDASNNRRGRWCAMRRCGNKLNARKYRRRYEARVGHKPRGGRIPGLRRIGRHQ